MDEREMNDALCEMRKELSQKDKHIAELGAQLEQVEGVAMTCHHITMQRDEAKRQELLEHAENDRCRAAFDPVREWYDKDGTRLDFPAMLRDAIEDLQRDRADALKLKACERERDALRARVAELEAELGKCEAAYHGQGERAETAERESNKLAREVIHLGREMEKRWELLQETERERDEARAAQQAEHELQVETQNRLIDTSLRLEAMQCNRDAQRDRAERAEHERDEAYIEIDRLKGGK